MIASFTCLCDILSIKVLLFWYLLLLFAYLHCHHQSARHSHLFSVSKLLFPKAPTPPLLCSSYYNKTDLFRSHITSCICCISLSTQIKKLPIFLLLTQRKLKFSSLAYKPWMGIFLPLSPALSLSILPWASGAQDIWSSFGLLVKPCSIPTQGPYSSFSHCSALLPLTCFP